MPDPVAPSDGQTWRHRRRFVWIKLSYVDPEREWVGVVVRSSSGRRQGMTFKTLRRDYELVRRA